MIGMVRLTGNIPAGAVVYFDHDRNALVIFDDTTGTVYAHAVPFVVETVEHDRVGRVQ